MKIAATMKSHEIKDVERFTLKSYDILKEARLEHGYMELDACAKMVDLILGTIENIGLYQDVSDDPEQEIYVSAGDLLCMKDCITTVVWISNEAATEHACFELFGAQMFAEMAWEIINKARRTL